MGGHFGSMPRKRYHVFSDAWSKNILLWSCKWQKLLSAAYSKKFY